MRVCGCALRAYPRLSPDLVPTMARYSRTKIEFGRELVEQVPVHDSVSEFILLVTERGMEVQHHAFDGDLDSGVLVGYALHVLRCLARAHEFALLDIGDAALCDSCDEVAG